MNFIDSSNWKSRDLHMAELRLDPGTQKMF